MLPGMWFYARYTDETPRKGGYINPDFKLYFLNPYNTLF